ncbi:hypothetical protein [Botrimarina sp.]|uniref:hypothetical protein n=1 Tax=Botrimarina sp. TaxID=2795802 RepID=UPI0032EC53B6
MAATLTADNTAFEVRDEYSVTLGAFNDSMGAAGYVGHRLFPLSLRTRGSGQYPKFRPEEEMFLEDYGTERKPDGTFKRSSAEWDADSYEVKTYGHEATIDDERSNSFDDVLSAERSEQGRLLNMLRREFERRIAVAATAEASYDVSRIKGGLTAWSDGAATVFADVDAQRDAFFDEFGGEPNALFLDRSDMRDALVSADVQPRLPGAVHVQPSELTMAVNARRLAIALDLDFVFVANATRNRLPSRDFVRLWPKGKAVLARVPVTDDPAEYCYGRTIVWDQFGDIEDDRIVFRAERYKEQRPSSVVVRARGSFVHKVLYPEGARLLLVDGAEQPT